MSKTLSIVLVVLAVLVLASGMFFAANLYGRGALSWSGLSFGYRSDTGATYGPSNMNGGYGRGMMGSGSQGRIRGYGRRSTRNTVASPLTINEAKTASEAYLVRPNNSDLELAEVMA